MEAAVVAQRPTAEIDEIAAAAPVRVSEGDRDVPPPVTEHETPRAARAAAPVLPGTVVFVLVLVFVVLIGMLAPRILGNATYAPLPTGTPAGTPAGTSAISVATICPTPDGCAGWGPRRCC